MAKKRPLPDSEELRARKARRQLLKRVKWIAALILIGFVLVLLMMMLVEG